MRGRSKAGTTGTTPSGWLEEKGANERTSARPRNGSSRRHDQSGGSSLLSMSPG